MLTKLIVTPTPRSALITGKAIASVPTPSHRPSSSRVLSALFGALFHTNALKLLAVAAVVVLEAGVLLVPVHEHRGRGAVPVPAHRAAHQHLAQRRRAEWLYGCRDHSGIDTMP